MKHDAYFETHCAHTVLQWQEEFQGIVEERSRARGMLLRGRRVKVSIRFTSMHNSSLWEISPLHFFTKERLETVRLSPKAISAFRVYLDRRATEAFYAKKSESMEDFFHMFSEHTACRLEGVGKIGAQKIRQFMDKFLVGEIFEGGV